MHFLCCSIMHHLKKSISHFQYLHRCFAIKLVTTDSINYAKSRLRNEGSKVAPSSASGRVFNLTSQGVTPYSISTSEAFKILALYSNWGNELFKSLHHVSSSWQSTTILRNSEASNVPFHEPANYVHIYINAEPRPSLSCPSQVLQKQSYFLWDDMLQR